MSRYSKLELAMSHATGSLANEFRKLAVLCLSSGYLIDKVLFLKLVSTANYWQSGSDIHFALSGWW